MTSVRSEAEDGFSLLELMIAMSIMAIIFVIVMQAMTGWIVNTERRATLSDQASDQLTSAYTVLDTEVRYASVISAPAESTTTSGDVGDYWVEFESDWSESSESSPTCYQLEYVTSTGVLQQRSWLYSNSASGGGAPTTASWQTLATGLSSAASGGGLSSGDPFALTKTAPDLYNPATPTTTTTTVASTTTTTTNGAVTETEATPWQLSFTLSSSLGAGTQTGAAATTFSIAAINVTSSSSNSSAICGGNPS